MFKTIALLQTLRLVRLPSPLPLRSLPPIPYRNVDTELLNSRAVALAPLTSLFAASAASACLLPSLLEIDDGDVVDVGWLNVRAVVPTPLAFPALAKSPLPLRPLPPIGCEDDVDAGLLICLAPAPPESVSLVD